MMSERIYHHYEQLEEFRSGMWRIVRGEARKQYAERAADLMRDSTGFMAAMRRAVAEWPISCQHNLTAEDTNRLAWLGHAGCCLGVGSSEENTRIGWHMLNADEQAEANRSAQTILDEWIAAHRPVAQYSLWELEDAPC
jgi:hypothetical protein